MTVEFMHRLAREIINLAEAVLEEKDPRVCRRLLGVVLGKVTDFI